MQYMIGSNADWLDAMPVAEASDIAEHPKLHWLSQGMPIRIAQPCQMGELGALELSACLNAYQRPRSKVRNARGIFEKGAQCMLKPWRYFWKGPGGYVPATKYDARRLRMASAATWMARSSASRRARWPAKRCCEPGMS